MTTTIATDTRVGQIASEHPLATRVFARHGIDFCCGGGKPLAEVCEAKGINAEQVVEEIRKELEAPGATETQTRWDEAPLNDLIDHILAAYHEPLHQELPRLEQLARKVAKVHGESTPDLVEILAVYLGLKAELDAHMAKEEQILFPMIRAGQGEMAGGPISVMLHEHDNAGASLTRLRELTNDYTVPEGACNSWLALWHGLAAMETDLHEHIHLENNILFPRALGD